MFKPILILSALFACFFFTANAQTDTSSYDLGRISVKKQFTQSITIKGSDLERTQFADLADAINVWLYGTYTNAASLVYVLEGNIITDINAYSIYDVDEITLVQNAVAQVTGIGPGQQLVFIKLKTNRPGKQGIEVAGQTSLVNANLHTSPSNYKSSSNLYDQFYLSGYKNFDAVQAGVSVDYQHDVMPYVTNNGYSAVDPLHFNRFKFNGYVNARLFTGTMLNFGINYVPQQNRESFTYDYPALVGDASDHNVLKDEAVQHLASSNISINSRIVKGLTNTLSAAYSHYNFFEGDSVTTVYTSPGVLPQTGRSFVGADIKTSNILLRDNLAYHTMIGVFDVEPSVNFSYRKYKSFYKDSIETLYYVNSFPSSSVSEEAYAFDEKLYLLTPSVNIAYKDAFNLQAGFVDLLNSSKDFNSNYKLPRVFPFVSASVDVFKLAQISSVSLQVFGSFSRQNQLIDDPYASLQGLSASLPVTSPGSGGFVDGTGSENLPVYPSSAVDPLKELNNYQAGFVLGVSKNFSISYNYQDSYSSDLLPTLIPYGANSYEEVYIYYYSRLITNRIGFNYNYRSNSFSWRAGLNIAQEKLETADPNVVAATYEAYLSDGHRYSGGFTNRFAYKTFFAGLDILYQLGERPITLADATPPQIVAPPHVNSVALQNLYLGAQVKLNNVKYAEVFVNFHNILENNSADITDDRRFYGLGIKVGW